MPTPTSLFTLSAGWQMSVLQNVVFQVRYILSDKLALKAAKGHVAPQVSFHLILCEEWYLAGPDSAWNTSEIVCGNQVGLIFLTLCTAELAALLLAEKWAFRITSTVNTFKVAYQTTGFAKSLTAQRTLVVPQLFFTGWIAQPIWTVVRGKQATVWATLATFFTSMRLHCLHLAWKCSTLLYGWYDTDF